MFNREWCPSGLFDMYIEVGDVKKSKFETNESVFIEIWIVSHFSGNCVREECKKPVRRPIYKVLQQIKELCGNKTANLLFMCDDMWNDTILWAEAILLLQQALENEKLIKHSVLYVRDSKEETENLVRSAKSHFDKSGEIVLSLLNMQTAVIYGQSNCYMKSENAYVYSKAPELPDEIKNYIRSTRKDI